MKILGYLLGGFLIVVGLVQLWCARYLLVNSMHMGSPIRLHGQRFLENLPPESRERAQGFLDLAGLGFRLADDAFWLLLGTGTMLFLVGLVVTTIAYAKRSTT